MKTKTVFSGDLKKKKNDEKNDEIEKTLILLNNFLYPRVSWYFR